MVLSKFFVGVAICGSCQMDSCILECVQVNMVRVLLWVYAGIGPLASMVSVASSWGAGGFFVWMKACVVACREVC